MKRITVLAFLTAALISMGSASAHAQALAFKAPFDFAVGDKTLPAGSYQVSYVTLNTILIRSTDLRLQAMAITVADDKESYGVGKLIFARYGNQYFLREVLCNDVSMNVEIPKSTREKQAHMQEAQLPHNETVAALQVGEK